MAKADVHFSPDESILKAVSKVIKEERAKRGLTQEALAIQSNLHWRHIQRFETSNLNPSLCSFIRIAKGFGLEPEELLKLVMDGVEV